MLVYPLSCLRIDLFQAGVKPFQRLSGEPPPELEVGPRTGEEPPDQGLHVECAPAYNQGEPPASFNLSNQAGDVAPELHHIVALVWFPDIDQVMGDSAALLRGGLGCADLQVFIERTRIGGDDLRLQPLGQPDGEAGLADPGRPEDDQPVGLSGLSGAGVLILNPR